MTENGRAEKPYTSFIFCRTKANKSMPTTALYAKISEFIFPISAFSATRVLHFWHQFCGKCRTWKIASKTSARNTELWTANIHF